MPRGKIWKSTVFTIAFKKALEFYGLKQKDIAEKIEIPTGRVSEYATGKTDPTIENVNKIVTAFGLSISEFFALADGTNHIPDLREKVGEAPAPPVAAEIPPAPPTISPEREMELLRKMEALTDDLRAAAAQRDYLADELHAADDRIKEKEKIISTTVEALRIKDIEVAEKREALTTKDQIISQLVGLLKEAGLEHTIPPALTSLIRANREKNQER